MFKVQINADLSSENSKFKFSKVSPSDTYEDVKNDLLTEEQKKHMKSSSKIENTQIDEQEEEETHAIGFWKAWLIPGVLQFAICIAFVKCATYGILLWLPAYADKELNYDNESIELIAITNDVGTIMGSITLGKISDLMYKKRSPIAFLGLIIGGILFLLIAFLSDSSKYIIYTLIFFVGFIVGGVFNVVTATAAADLAKGEQIKGNSKALSTVTGILDGCGSLGAAFGSLIIGEIRKKSWNAVFIFLAWAVFISSLPIFRVMLKEIREIKSIRNRDRMIINHTIKSVEHSKK